MMMTSFFWVYVRYYSLFKNKFPIKSSMAYYLSDPYYYSPKCFPFLNNDWTYAERLHSERSTTLGRKLQTRSAICMLEQTSENYDQRLKCEQNLLRCKYLMSDRENGASLAEIESNRRVKQQGLRKQSHKFPKFMQHTDLINQVKRKYERINPEDCEY